MNFPENTKYFNLIMVDNAFVIPGEGTITFNLKFKQNDKIITTITPEYVLEVASSSFIQ